MTACSRALVLIALLTAGTVPAQQSPDPAEPTEDPCRVDERLSLVLSLGAVDRTIGALEKERRTLVVELAQTRKMIDLLYEEDRGDDVPLTELGTLMSARTAGRDTVDETYAQLETRLVDIEETLKRRRRLQATLEVRIEVLLTDGDP